MSSFRIRDLIVAVVRGLRAEPAAHGDKRAEADKGTECEGAGCVAGTYGIYACLQGRSFPPPPCAETYPLCAPTRPPPCGYYYGATLFPACAPTRGPPIADPHLLLACTRGCSEAPIDCMSIDELASLKAELAKAIVKVDEQAGRLHHAAEQRAKPPETIAEIKELQAKLAEAIKDLEAKRAELERDGPPGSKAGG